MQTQHFNACDSLHHRLHGRPRYLDQMRPYLLEQVSALFGLKRLYQVLFRRSQNTFEPDDNQIINQVSANVLGSPTHVFLFKAAHAV
jgi:hypothetical protein